MSAALRRVLLLLALAVLAACSSPPKAPSGGAAPPSRPVPQGPPGRDGPPPAGSPDPMALPNAEPKVEPIRQGGPNKPYEVAGTTYVPQTGDAPMVEAGLASWYGRAFHGRRTASGETYNMHAMTAAHKTMPIPSYARVRNPANGREVIVRINDRGPFAKGRIIDLSWAAAVKLDVHGGVRPVEVERITYEEIRAGLGRARGRPDETAVAVAPPPVTAPVLTAPAAAPPVAAAPVPASPAVPAADPALDKPPESARAFTTAGVGWWLQLGAFSRPDGAQAFHQKVAEQADWLAPLLAVFREGALHRLQAGPYPSRDEARSAAERVREALQLVPVLVERR
ncbi:septal ring lytic transglycosylase RlpA family protein [Ideonella sp. 4Y11]|uniref:Endolytic peptidoglycan transglycosylase RlpA n=1 Tax=Ideonella aquatica TaxID=2824119 RepID=A0A941BSC6_9BURK|nr:septal ring lytic transglycosylase RlpA family protein [Ideonella aquatica]MBQ0961500.1 septal ring lytic transglycosylase RlpA family protein [Ideonella aquatica]